MNQKSRSYLVFGLIFIITLVVYRAAILNPKFLNYDQEMVIWPLKQVTGLANYFQLRKLNLIFDICPVSDLSHLVDLKLEQRFPQINWGILQNIIIWLGIIYLFFKSLETTLNNEFKYYLILILAFHPLAHQSVAWGAARKHLLSAFFILLSYLTTKQFINEKKIKWAIFSIITYGLSVYSWPISLLVPFAFVYEIIKDKEIKNRWLISLSFILIFLVTISLNEYYYSNNFYEQIGQLKYVKVFQPLVSLNGLGRAFYQIVFPFEFASTYSEYSLQNFIGLVGMTLLVAFLYAYKKLDIKNLILCVSPLLVVLVFPTKLFVMDTYILIPLIFFLVRFQNVKLTTPKRAVLLVVVATFIATSYSEIKIRENRKTFDKRSYENEKTCINQKQYLKGLWNSGELNKSILIYHEFIQDGCHSGIDLAQIYLYALFIDKQTTNSNKLEVLTSTFKTSKLAQIMKISLSETMDLNKVKKINEVLLIKGDVIRTPFLNKDNVIFSSVINFCLKNKGTDECKLFEKNLERIEHRVEN